MFHAIFFSRQGVDSTDQREVSTTVSISEIPFIMRALGYYPTEQEVSQKFLLWTILID